MKITAEFIPHEQFHLGKWMVSVKRSSWYYFHKCRNSNEITNKKFMQSVDPPLQKLVDFLHNKGIKTTPSCSGHHKKRKQFKKIYTALRKDAGKISGNGLVLKEVETGKKFVYRDRNYQLPWTRKKFLSQVKNYQDRGILGMRINDNKEMKNKLLQLKIKGLEVKERNSIVLFFIANGNGQHKKIWKKITNAVKKIYSRYNRHRRRKIIPLWKGFWRK